MSSSFPHYLSYCGVSFLVLSWYKKTVTLIFRCFVDIVAEEGEKKTFTLRTISSEPSNVTEENEGSEVSKIL